MSRIHLACLAILLSALAAPAAFATDFVFHYPDSGAPPWLFIAPGGNKPTGVVADVLEEAARHRGRALRYEFLPRENNNDSLRKGSAGGALFFSATRPLARDLLAGEPLMKMDSVLVTLKDKPLGYRKPADLKDQRLCTLSEEIYPPLTLLAMNGTLMQRKAKTGQAQLLMLRNEDCVAAVLNGPMYQWLAAKYRWDDLRVEKQPLLQEQLVLGFAAGERDMLNAVDQVVRRLRDSGELPQRVARYLPGGDYVSPR